MGYVMRKNSGVRVNWQWARLVVLAGISCLGWSAQGQTEDPLLPDFAFQIDCSQNSRPDFDDQVIRYLTQQGFRVVDVAKSHGISADDPDRHVLRGIDRHDRIVSVVSFPRRPNHLTFSLLSLPPTHHDLAFDGAVQSFFSRDLICEVSQITTNDNGVDGVASFRAQVGQLDSLLQAAEGLDPSSAKH